MEDLEEIAENNDEKEPRNRYSEGFQDGFDRGMLASVIIGILFLGAYKIMPYIPKIKESYQQSFEQFGKDLGNGVSYITWN